MFVRLKPFDPKRGNFLRDYIAPWGTKFKNGIWYEVDPKAAKYLSTIFQKHDNPFSSKAFNVGSEMQAKSIIEREEMAELDKVVPEKRLEESIAPEKATVKAAYELNRPKPTHELTAPRATAKPVHSAKKKKTSRKKTTRKKKR